MIIEYYACNLARYANLYDIERVKLENRLIEPLIDIIQKTVLPKVIQKITVYYKYTTGWNDYSKDLICENFSLHRLELTNFTLPLKLIVIYIKDETITIQAISVNKSLCVKLYDPNFIENFQKSLNEFIF